MAALLRLMRFLQNSAGALVVSFILLLASTGLGLVQPRLIEYAIDNGISPESFRPSPGAQRESSSRPCLRRPSTWPPATR